MNNEEKILALLEKMNERQDKTEAILEQMQGDIQELKQGQAKLETGQRDTNARIDMLQDTMDERFDAVDEKLANLESSINYAAKDAKLYIQRHEKEFHNVG